MIVQAIEAVRMDEFDWSDAYAAPLGTPSKGGGVGDADETPDLRFLARWERMRVVYNVVLAVMVLLCSGIGSWRAFLDPTYWELLIAGAFGANVCYCVGPVAEAYLRWLGVRGRSLGLILFGAGLLVSVPLTFFLVVGYLLARAGF